MRLARIKRDDCSEMQRPQSHSPDPRKHPCRKKALNGSLAKSCLFIGLRPSAIALRMQVSFAACNALGAFGYFYD